MLSRISEVVTGRIVPMSRQQRRLTGRIYGHAAWRRMRELEHELYGGAEHGYKEHSAHPAVVKYIIEGRVKLEQEQTAQAAEAHDEQGVHMDVQSHDDVEQHPAVEAESSGEVSDLSQQDEGVEED